MSAARADKLVQQLAERELDALLVTNLVNVRYLSGFTGTNAICVVTPNDRVFLTDFKGHYERMNSVYATYFEKGRFPARTCVGVTGLARDCLVEIDFIARRSKK